MEGMNARRVIKGIEEFITAVREDSSAWKSEEPKWFRGKPESTTALVPTLYRPGPTQHENALLQMFRARASGYHDAVPIREHTDQWLFVRRYAVDPACRQSMINEVALLGITDSVVFPDLDGLATELKERFGFRCP
jgi:hypothetical protein